jgi:hypothetical protein
MLAGGDTIRHYESTIIVYGRKRNSTSSKADREIDRNETAPNNTYMMFSRENVKVSIIGDGTIYLQNVGKSTITVGLPWMYTDCIADILPNQVVEWKSDICHIYGVGDSGYMKSPVTFSW